MALSSKSKQTPALPEIGEQIVLRVGTGQREFEFLATVAMRTVDGFECTISNPEIERSLLEMSQRASIGTMHSKHIPVNASYTRESGGVYHFASALYAVVKNDKMTLNLLMPVTVRKSQRRQDYRLPLATKVSLRTINAKPNSADLINISATGAMVISEKQIDAGQQLEFTIDGTESDYLVGIVDAVVIECIRTPDQPITKPTFTLRLGFDDGTKVKLPPKQREQIVRYIFEQQRQMLRLRTLIGD